MFESTAYPKHSFLHGSDGNILESKTIVFHSSQWHMTIQSARESKAHQKRTFLPSFASFSVRKQCCGSGAFLTRGPGSGIVFSGSWIPNLYHIFESFVTIFLVKSILFVVNWLKFLNLHVQRNTSKRRFQILFIQLSTQSFCSVSRCRRYEGDFHIILFILRTFTLNVAKTLRKTCLF
jgi:hypothetical protein